MWYHNRPWASFWYDSVHKTTGFGDASGTSSTGYVPGSYRPLSPEQLQLLREAIPFYDLLRQHAYVGSGGDAMCRGFIHTPAAVPSLPRPRMAADRGDHDSSTAPSSGLTDPRNADILIWVGDRLLPRERAALSVFDSSVQGGDAIWEGIRIYGQRMFKLEEHLDRLYDSARALGYVDVPSREYVKGAIRRTLIGKETLEMTSH